MPYKTNYYLYNIKQLFLEKSFKGWGRKKTGRFAKSCHKYFGGELTLLEDGFIRSIGLGVEGAKAFSIIEDDRGIYYDATTPSKLEYLLNTYNFQSDTKLMAMSKEAIKLIQKYHISKYNHAPLVHKQFFQGDKNEKVLIIAQTKGDSALKYGKADNFTTKEIIEDAIKENPYSSIYIKIHPDVLSGKKYSDINIKEIPKECTIIQEDINPISLLSHFKKVYTKTSGMGMEALIVGCHVTCYGIPYYSSWGLTTDKQKCERRKRVLTVEEVFAGAYILYTQYYNPYSQQNSDIIDTIHTLIKYRNLSVQNSQTLYFFGFSLWKQKFIKKFFPTTTTQTIQFCSSLEDALTKGLKLKDKIYIWGKKPFDEVEQYSKKHHCSLFRVEDGFIRSISLGSDLTKAYSLVVDSRGIYFDATSPSDLEVMLNNMEVTSSFIQRSKDIQHTLITNRISKYNLHQDKTITLPLYKKNQKILLVIGQVQDDASIQYGAKGMKNITLLQEVKKVHPHDYIIYKPHPDVLVGNRVGHIDKKEALKYCHSVITDISLDSILEIVDEVHTITSLVGFEALIRGKKVYTYGLPFYAGWGLTIDKKQSLRRTKKRSLDELVAVTLIIYPQYIHPKTNELCEIEILLKEIDKEKKRYNQCYLYRKYIQIRNLISRKIQLIIKVLKDEYNRRNQR